MTFRPRADTHDRLVGFIYANPLLLNNPENGEEEDQEAVEEIAASNSNSNSSSFSDPDSPPSVTKVPSFARGSLKAIWNTVLTPPSDRSPIGQAGGGADGDDSLAAPDSGSGASHFFSDTAIQRQPTLAAFAPLLQPSSTSASSPRAQAPSSTVDRGAPGDQAAHAEIENAGDETSSSILTRPRRAHVQIVTPSFTYNVSPLSANSLDELPEPLPSEQGGEPVGQKVDGKAQLFHLHKRASLSLLSEARSTLMAERHSSSESSGFSSSSESLSLTTSPSLSLSQSSPQPLHHPSSTSPAAAAAAPDLKGLRARLRDRFVAPLRSGSLDIPAPAASTLSPSSASSSTITLQPSSVLQRFRIRKRKPSSPALSISASSPSLPTPSAATTTSTTTTVLTNSSLNRSDPIHSDSDSDEGNASPSSSSSSLSSSPTLSRHSLPRTPSQKVDMICQSRNLSALGLAVRQRLELVIDLLESERTYSANLMAWYRSYHGALTMLASPDDVKLLFGPVGNLVDLHSSLANDMQARLRTWKPEGKYVDVMCDLRSAAKHYCTLTLARSRIDHLVEQAGEKSGTRLRGRSKRVSYSTPPTIDSCQFLDNVGVDGLRAGIAMLRERGHVYLHFLEQYAAVLEPHHVDSEVVEALVVDLRAALDKGSQAANEGEGEDGEHRSISVDPGILEFLLNTPHKLRVQPDLEYDREKELERSVWDEATDDELIMREPFRRFEVQYATVNRLVMLLATPPLSDLLHKERFMTTFFRTYRTFCPAPVLLDKLVECFLGAKDETHRVAVIKVFCFWTNFHWMNLSSPSFGCLPQLNEFVAELNSRKAELDPRVATGLRYLAKLLHRKTADPAQRNSTIVPTRPALAWLALPAVTEFTPDNFLDLLEPEEIAQQLCLMDFHVYSSIDYTEWLGLAWQGKQGPERAPNLLAFISNLNKISSLCSYAVVSSTSVTRRKQVISRICKCMTHLLVMQNFGSLIALSSSLQESSVFRLKKTFSALSQSKLGLIQQMKAVFDPSSNYKVFRCLYNSCQGPCIPFVGIFLSDVTFTEEGNKEFVNGLVNFQKRSLISDIISQALAHQSNPFPFQPNESLIAFLQNQPEIDSNQLYSLSLVAEPRVLRT